MSHIVQIKTELRDPAAIAAACRRLNLSAPVQGEHRLYSARHTGLGVQLPGWKYPIVCRPETGEVLFDNFEGRWGPQSELDKFQQTYAVSKAVIEASRHGHFVTEQTLPDGSIKLTINVGG